MADNNWLISSSNSTGVQLPPPDKQQGQNIGNNSSKWGKVLNYDTDREGGGIPDKKDGVKTPTKHATTTTVNTDKVPTPTYAVDYYRKANAKLKDDMVMLKSASYIDPYSTARKLMGLIPNGGLYGKILVLKRGKDKYEVLFPPPVSKDYKTLEGAQNLINGKKVMETYNNDTAGFWKNAFNVWDRLAYSKFAITSLSIPQREIVALEQGFGDYWDIHFYGKSPIQLNVSGALLNAYNPITHTLYAWAEDWYNNYLNYFRGGIVAQQNARTFLIAGNYVFSGFITASSQSVNANSDGVIGLGFSMIVVDVSTFSKEAFESYVQSITESRKNNKLTRSE